MFFGDNSFASWHAIISCQGGARYFPWCYFVNILLVKYILWGIYKTYVQSNILKFIYHKIVYYVRMGKIKVTVDGYKCERCGHEWIPRNKKTAPRVCPECKSPYWDVPRKKADKR